MSDSAFFLPIGSLLVHQYKILMHIGAGGFGKTYLVEDQLGAKKVVKEFFMSSMCTRDTTTQSISISINENKKVFQQHLARFKDEARRIYSLSHPNIVKVSALFDENDTAYYVMDYIEGESLTQKCHKMKLSESQIMRYLDQLLSALDYIHSRGLTHLDIKPSNIMIDQNDNVVLIDFGASKLFNAQSVNKTMNTSMAPPYTPGYAPIEQENGNAKDLGPHCDIYALGATLYYLYTGEKPASPFEISQSGLPSIPNASPAVEEMIKKAMAFWVKDRIKSAAEFRVMLSNANITSEIKADADAINSSAGMISSDKTMLLTESSDLPSIKSSDESLKSSPSYTQLAPPQIDRVGSVSGESSSQEDLESYETNTKTKGRSVVLIISLLLITILGVFIWQGRARTETELKEEVLDTTSLTFPKDNFTETVNGVSFNMIAVEGGTFDMGATPDQGSGANANEKPVHQVTLSDYYIGETEVTQELWEAVMDKNPSFYKGAKRPVEFVLWDDCKEFINKLNDITGKKYRFPTEAEWEYAARGGNKSRKYKYSGSNNIANVAWYDKNAYYVGQNSSAYGTHSVGLKRANELGIYDMSGNVWEWCSDLNGDYSSSPQINPKGSSTGSYHILRGGSWNLNAQISRVAFRYYNTSGHLGNYGLRLVLSP